MGCFDGAEICELAGIYNLNLLKSIIRKENVGLYRDDGLSVLRNETERLRKRIIKIFKDGDHHHQNEFKNSRFS